MNYSGNLLKMRTELHDEVHYHLALSGQEIHMNDLIGKEVTIKYQNIINCIKCGRQTKKSFAQGYCYPCFITAPETEECVLRPELCRAHEGIARDMIFAEEHCLIDHFVYLALSSGVKVGVTRNHQVPHRWIDQGAWKAIKLAVTPNRYIAGIMEVGLKQYFTDKTNWRHMLTNKLATEMDLVKQKDRAIELLHPDLRVYAIDDDTVTEIKYPVIHYPEKVKSINLDTTSFINDTLTGIKGQYLIFDSGTVLNIRKHNGYLVELSF